VTDPAKVLGERADVSVLGFGCAHEMHAKKIPGRHPRKNARKRRSVCTTPPVVHGRIVDER
jgi:hypothetical protein